MIALAVGRGTSADARARYDTALACVWSDLSRTLSRLEELAADPDLLDDDALEVLPHLQYSLHRASELTAGIDPPAGQEGAHEELAAALADARDLTGEAWEALELGGGSAVAVLVHEWRGALFRVRLARRRLTTSDLPSVGSESEPRERLPRAAAAATALAALGVITFAGGAVIASWPIWALGLALLACGFLVYRP
ncbi:MAG: hypothetical protein C5B48_03920 [Candidatus Rokuibacteriota bacterium]|nr:MAG: hypothetical protein C5B48_03920 [Candidatus Rokubacteria bacterium]